MFFGHSWFDISQKHSDVVWFFLYCDIDLHKQILEMFDFCIAISQKFIYFEVIDIVDGVIGSFDELIEYNHIFFPFEVVHQFVEIKILCSDKWVPNRVDEF